MNNDEPKDYNNLPSNSLLKDPVEEGDVLHVDEDTSTGGLGQAQDVNNNMPDSPLVDGNIEEANTPEDTAEEA